MLYNVCVVLLFVIIVQFGLLYITIIYC